MTDAHGHRLTRNEDIVLDALRQAARPLSAYQIMEQTTSRGVRAPQQIYRALQGLVGHRLIHRIETINAYLACQHAAHEHQAAFTVCTSCGRVEEVPLGKTIDSLTQAVARTGFAVQATHLELSGLCAACQAPDKA